VFERVQASQLAPVISNLKAAVKEEGLQSERALALFFYSFVGYHSAITNVGGKADYQRDVKEFEKQKGRTPNEQERMSMLSSESCVRVRHSMYPWMARWYCPSAEIIAEGSGTAFGRDYDLASLGIELRNLDTGKPIDLREKGSGQDASGN
jgi:hypothetical protein